MAVSEDDLEHLRRCADLARLALQGGDEPFGSLLVDHEDAVRFEDHNRVKDGDATRHPEFAIARWAAENLDAEQRAHSTVYTSGEHCPMCAPPSPVAPLPINTVAPGVVVDGPAPELTETMKLLYGKAFGG